MLSLSVICLDHMLTWSLELSCIFCFILQCIFLIFFTMLLSTLNKGSRVFPTLSSLLFKELNRCIHTFNVDEFSIFLINFLKVSGCCTSPSDFSLFSLLTLSWNLFFESAQLWFRPWVVLLSWPELFCATALCLSTEVWESAHCVQPAYNLSNPFLFFYLYRTVFG